MLASITKLFKRAGGRSVAPAAPAAAPLKRAGVATTSRQAYAEASAETDSGDRLAISFSAILKSLPDELHGKKNSPESAGGKFFIPRSLVLQQITKGSVRVPFGEIRRSAPPGVFTLSNTEDERLIELPLKELLPQLKATEMTRRSQHRVEVPEDIANLFGAGSAAVRVMAKQEAGGTTFERKAAAAPAPEPAPAPIAAPAARKQVPAAPGRSVPRQGRAAAATAAATPASKATTARGETATPGKIPVPASLAAAMAEAAPTPTPAPPAFPIPDTSTKLLSVKLVDLAANWPESIQREIKSSSMVNATCEVPASVLSKSLKQGKVELPWKQIRSWLKPAVSGPSAMGETVLQLPLEILAPIFLGQKPPSPAQKKVEVAPDIPDIFSRGPAAQSAPAPTIPAPQMAAVVPAPPQPAAPAPASAVTVLNERPELEEGPPREVKTGPVPISLSLLAANWPPNLVKEIDTQFMAKAKLEIPIDALEPGMRTGKVDFLWKQLFSWLEPAAPASLIAAHAETRIELPLSVVAPLFLQRRPSQGPKRQGITVDVPDVFQPAAPEHPPAGLGAMISAPDGAGHTEIRRRVQDLADLFGQPDKRNWTPNEIVQNTSALPGIAGALIALQDGLLVASCMPPEWRTETIAAFLPQIFGRMNQYTKELKMGELHSVNLAVDTGSVQIFAAGIIYFAVLSKPETPLPLYELNLIAKELSRHTK